MQLLQTKRSLSWTMVLFFTFIHMVALTAPLFFTWQALALTVFLHWFLGCVGITLCYHRLLAHRSFVVPKWFEYVLAFIGTLNMQSGPIFWVSRHRRHHAHPDTDDDPHSSKWGFWWSHMGWVLYDFEAFNTLEKYRRYAPDLARDPVYVFFDRYFALFQVALGVLFYFLGGWPFVVWGIFVRLVFVFHATWFVNSATHFWGYRTFETKDDARNLWWVALVTWGEGWHNNHHAQPKAARTGLLWWELDPTYWVIWLFEKVGLARSVHPHVMPSKATGS
ncbi:acyl-CoA desaturase [Anthocerotibacter panamensis]|uniref:acyl-CoA desaturase n=1 Tax=Anthocerotibacter panamensis TaxID=2857077 RepID=UPI001C4089B8|nr:fatty acid desaturase [Anthocerotibacter panamensis]